MRPSHIILALSMTGIVVNAPAALAQSPDPHHPPAVAAPAGTNRDQPVAPQAVPQQPAQPGQKPQGGMMMDCSTMQSGRAEASGSTNCRMMQEHMQSGHMPSTPAPGTVH